MSVSAPEVLVTHWLAVLVLTVSLAAPALAQDAKGGAVPEAPATMVVVNQLDRPVTIWINHEMKGRIEAGAEARFGGLSPGRVSVKAGSAAGGGPVASETRQLAAGQTFTWILHPVIAWGEEKGTGTVVVANGLEREVAVSLGGQEAGMLGPGAVRAYARVVAGKIAAVARDTEGAVVGEQTLELGPGRIVRWEIGSR